MTTREEKMAELAWLARVARAREEFRQWREKCQLAGEKVPPPWEELPGFVRRVWLRVAQNKMAAEAKEALHG